MAQEILNTERASAMEAGEAGREEEQDGMSVHSPCKAPPSSASSLSKEQAQVDLELRLLEALAIYPPSKLQGRAISPHYNIQYKLFSLSPPIYC